MTSHQIKVARPVSSANTEADRAYGSVQNCRQGEWNMTATNNLPTERDLLTRTLPLLVQLGDFIGNGEIDPTRPDSVGIRCDLIGDIKRVLTEEYNA